MVKQIASTMTLAVCVAAAMGQGMPPMPPQTMEYRAMGSPQSTSLAVATVDTVRFIGAEFHPGGGTVKGAPYSADAATESVQVLADGTRITHKNTSSDYRDSDGRTRHEQTLDTVGPWSSDQSHKLIFINDPVAGVNYVLDPQQRTANKMTLHQTTDMADLPPGMKTADAAPGMKKDKVFFETSDMADLPPGMKSADAAPGMKKDKFFFESGTARQGASPELKMGAAFGVTSRRAVLADDSNAKTESLGTKMIEGVQADGTKTTTTIPVGRIGNDRAFQIVSERWYSPELQLVVMSKHTDPQAGEQTFQLTNIRRGEPSRTLFDPPADYTLQEGPQQIMFDRKGEKSAH